MLARASISFARFVEYDKATLLEKESHKNASSKFIQEATAQRSY